jgi:hypothetical protein
MNEYSRLIEKDKDQYQQYCYETLTIQLKRLLEVVFSSSRAAIREIPLTIFRLQEYRRSVEEMDDFQMKLEQYSESKINNAERCEKERKADK